MNTAHKTKEPSSTITVNFHKDFQRSIEDFEKIQEAIGFFSSLVPSDYRKGLEGGDE